MGLEVFSFDEGDCRRSAVHAAFVLLNFDPKRINTKTIEAAAAQRHMPFQTVAIEEPAVAKLYERPLVLVRPDGHVAWRGLDVPGNADSLIQRLCGVWKAQSTPQPLDTEGISPDRSS